MDHNNLNLPNFTASSYTTSNIPAGSALWSSDGAVERRLAQEAFKQYANINSASAFMQQPKEISVSTPVQIKSKLRVVRVFLVDTDERVPVDKRILHRSDEMTTDATDQELYFDIPVTELLKKHNAVRATVEWEEKTSEGTRTRTGLKEARIRDLTMSVTTVAQF